MRLWCILIAAAILQCGCVTMDLAASKAEIVSTTTAFTRNTDGSIQKVEFKVTETGRYIGPDGKVFRAMPDDKAIQSRYAR